MKNLLILLLLALSPVAFATTQDHTCQGGHNCNTNDIPPQSSQDQSQEQGQAQSQGQSQVANATAVAGASASVDSNNVNLNENTNVANGGRGGDGGAGGAGYGGNQSQGQSSSNDNSNSNSGNNSAQLTSVNVSTAASKTWRYSNNVSAVAPNIYSSSACTAGGLTGAASALGVGVSLGGAKQDPQCQIRENARILAGMDAGLGIEYLCRNPGIDVGKVLGSLCKYTPPVVEQPIELPPVETPPVIITDDVKGK